MPEFASNDYYNHLDINGILEYWRRRYVDVIAAEVNIERSTLADGGAGFGWLAFAYLLSGGGHAILVEPHAGKLAAAQAFARILGLEHRCTFFNCYLQDVPLLPRSVEAFASVEMLEHVGAEGIGPCIAKMAETSSCLVLLTTPNKAFPIDSHDTRLPFCHWLPKPMRGRYAAMFGYPARRFNDYAGPWHLRPLMREFRPVSRVLMYSSLPQWRATYPYLSPYRKGIFKERPPAAQALLYQATSRLLGPWAFTVNNNLASTWIRRGSVRWSRSGATKTQP